MNLKMKSKALVFILFYLLFSISVSAQKMKYDKETNIITVDGVPYAKMERSNASVAGLNNNFSIQNLEGKELMYIKLDTRKKYNRYGEVVEENVGYEIIFIDSGRSVWKRNTMGAKGAMKLVVKNKLIKDNDIDPEAERSFLLKY